MSTHQLRATYATDVVDKYGIRLAQDLLGHKDPKTTARYTKVDDTRKREAVASLYQQAS